MLDLHIIRPAAVSAETRSNPPVMAIPSESSPIEDWKFSGQVLLRSEMDGRDFDHTTAPLFWTVMRTRLTITKTWLEKYLELFVQLEDARTFGDLGMPIGNLRNIDMYQGYVQVNRLFGQELDLQIGRIELDYGNGRLFSPLPGWNYIGQSFDGGRLRYHLPDWFNLHLDAFSVVIKNSTPAIRPNPSAYPLKSNPGHGIHGLWSSAEFAPEAKIDLFGYYEINQNETKAGYMDINRWTLGLNHRGKYLDGFINTTLEAVYQVGKVSDLNVNAYLLSASAFVNPDDFHMGAGMDFVSGNPVNSIHTNHAFSQSFGNNHAFYGYMDYFLNIPVSTKSLGLNDYYLKTLWAPKQWPWEIAFDLHHMTSNQMADNGQSIFGQEADLTLTYKQEKNRYIWGLSAYLPGGLFTSADFFGSNRSGIAFWSYLQAIVNF